MSSAKEITLPKGWEIKSLADIGNIFSGNSINAKLKEEKYENTQGTPYVATKDISYNSVINYDNGINIPLDDVNKFRLAKKDTIFICAEGGSAGRKVGLLNQDVYFVNKLFALETNSDINSKFCFYWYLSKEFKSIFKNKLKGLIGGVSKTDFKKLPIPIPPIYEQKRIVVKIDNLFTKIDKAITLTEQSLKQAKNLLPSVLKKVFEKGKADGWEEKKLVDLKESNIIGLVRNAKQQSLDFSFEYVKMNNVTNDNRFTFNNITRVEANEKEVEKFKLVKGDFLFNTRNSFELVGKSCIYDSDKENVLYNNNLMRLRFKNGINPYFILYQFSSPFLISQLRKIKSGTTNVCAIYYHSLKDILLLVSSSDTQDKLVVYFNDISEKAQQTQSKLEKQLAYLKQLKSSILSKAFKGEL